MIPAETVFVSLLPVSSIDKRLLPYIFVVGAKLLTATQHLFVCLLAQ